MALPLEAFVEGDLVGYSKKGHQADHKVTQMPFQEPLDGYFPELCRMVAKTSWLPDPDTVRRLGVVFPTVRANTQHPRFSSLFDQTGQQIGMYDDNTTPTWALLWSHGIVGGSRKGWGFSHIWPASYDIKSYTHLANLAMIPECFSSLTDKDGPLTSYLRWHAWTVYKWKPDSFEPPQMPPGYDEIKWRYFERIDDPLTFVRKRLDELQNQRVTILRSINQENASSN